MLFVQSSLRQTCSLPEAPSNKRSLFPKFSRQKTCSFPDFPSNSVLLSQIFPPRRVLFPQSYTLNKSALSSELQLMSASFPQFLTKKVFPLQTSTKRNKKVLFLSSSLYYISVLFPEGFQQKVRYTIKVFSSSSKLATSYDNASLSKNSSLKFSVVKMLDFKVPSQKDDFIPVDFALEATFLPSSAFPPFLSMRKSISHCLKEHCFLKLFFSIVKSLFKGHVANSTP